MIRQTPRTIEAAAIDGLRATQSMNCQASDVLQQLGEGGADTLLALVTELKRRAYRFVVTTPNTHSRVLARDSGPSVDLRDVFGWNRPFEASLLGDLFEPLRSAGLLEAAAGATWRSRVRAASLGEDLVIHSSFPTQDPQAVFLGPDSYRFARLLRQTLSEESFKRAIDVGGGAGVGAITLARYASVGELVMTDVNASALALARINLRAAGIEAVLGQSGSLEDVQGEVDLIVANPPFIAKSGKTYSDGGDRKGAGVSVEWALAALRRLAPGGRFVMYTGSAITGGEDHLEGALRKALAPDAAEISYDEIDPDIFGEELDRETYADVERIEAVGVVVIKA